MTRFVGLFVCFELFALPFPQDAVAVASLCTGKVPPIVNHVEHDPLLGQLNLSCGGSHNCTFALHFAAGFGSQVTYVLYMK